MKRNQLIHDLLSVYGLTQRMMHSKFQLRFGEKPLAPAQLQVMFVLSQCQKISPKELAKRLYLTPGAVTQSIDALLASGYISRIPDLKDRRMVHVSLTAAGEKVISELSSKREQIFTELVQGLTNEELVELLRLHQKILDSLNATDQQNTANDNQNS